MVQTIKHQEATQILKGKIIDLYQYLLAKNDIVHTEKLKELARKLDNREYAIAFCGHFSAGKSTMINKVVGENLLPSSPIPTSANLVKVKSGEEYAKVVFKEDKPRIYLAPYDYEMVKNYCKDGDQIKEIEISHKESKLPANTIIMDTPGIDSADDAHRIATESAIHLADLIFYVMDYNHVQSELNFIFTKELTEARKEVYLVINQVDKHKEEELSFEEFQKSVEESFAAWGVNPPRIFYTSMKKEDYKFNQYTELQDFIQKKLSMKDEFFTQSISHSLRNIADDYMEQVQKNNEMNLQASQTIINELSADKKESIDEDYCDKKESLGLLENQLGNLEKEFEIESSKILKNCYLMPSQTRLLAEAYLESCQPDFKVGFLFGKQKTIIEREERLERFYQDFLEKAKTQLEWHLKDFLNRLLKDNELDQPVLLEKAQEFSLHFTKELLASAVKSGARLSGSYVLTYTDDVANEIKKIAKNYLNNFKVYFLNCIKARNLELKISLQNELKQIERYFLANEELKEVGLRTVNEQMEIEALLSRNDTANREQFDPIIYIEEEYEVIRGEVPARSSQPLLEKVNTQRELVTVTPNHSKGSEWLKETALRLTMTAQAISSLPGFQKLALELDEKAKRLENKGFTVALFGAFSAGKSSFANALMGEAVLPVSPNPTTAAINKIKPVTEKFPHGLVHVKVKEEASMLDDINRSLNEFDLQAETMDEALEEIGKIPWQKEQIVVSLKTHYAFLQAFKKGYSDFNSNFGEILTADLNQFQDFVAKEEKSCFVEWIDLYYDCELTRKGITLVDTPGADSINARHTGVAFDYIKNSDAILFVTYFNHAFSKADREFIIQLGRVKDSFQLDKMFFIINAIDLAESEEEKDLVANYVEEQLLKYGIRNPNLHSLSSMLSLKEKNEKMDVSVSGMGQFEDSFYPFIANDLTKMAISSSEIELNRVDDLVEKLIQSSREDQSLKIQKRAELEDQKVRIKNILETQVVDHLKNRLFQEGNELIYYIHQRVFLRFGDFFKEAFNPALLKDDGRNLKKVLQLALNEMLESIGFDFAQEMRATTVRLDRFAYKLMSDFQGGLIRSMSEINHDLSFSLYEFKNEEMIEFQSAFTNSNLQLFQKALSYFKNPKAFFEKNEKKLMSDELHQILISLADNYLLVEKERIKNHYDHVLSSEFTQLITLMTEQADDFYLSLVQAIDGGVSINQLISVQQKLNELK